MKKPAPGKMRSEPKKSFDDWKELNAASLQLVNGRLDYINRPNWHGSFTKGGNAYDFSGNTFSGVTIYDAFAEGLNIQQSVFTDVIFEEGDFSRANFQGCKFTNTRFNKTIFTDANFNGSSFVNCNLNRVNLTNAQFCLEEIRETVVYGIAAWDLHTCDQMKQSKLIIERTYQFYSDFEKEGRLPLMVDDIELAQFIHYLSDHKRMRNTINIFNNRGVLLLGQFNNGGKERLYKIHEWLKGKDYMPMIFDFNRPDQLNLTETIIESRNLRRLGIATGIAVSGFIIQKFFPVNRFSKKRHEIVYVKMK